MITVEFKGKILEALAARRANFTGSDARFAVAVAINNAQYSRIKRGDVDRVLSDAQWLTLARKLNVDPSNAPKWIATETAISRTIGRQLEDCQVNARSIILCEQAGIGKTFTARLYAETHANVAFVDCSQSKSRTDMIRAIAREFGVPYDGRFAKVYQNLVYYLKVIDKPLIVFDEAGDLGDAAFLELKALWNATQYACGFYLMGADVLKAKIKRAIARQKVGYTELFSRFGSRYFALLPDDPEQRIQLMRNSAARIIQNNIKALPDDKKPDVNEMLRRSFDDDNIASLRRIYAEITRLYKA